MQCKKDCLTDDSYYDPQCSRCRLLNEGSNRVGNKISHNSRQEREMVLMIQSAYILAAIIWLILVIIFNLGRTNFLGYVVLTIPIWVFLLGFVNICLVDRVSEREALSLSYLTVGLIVLFPIIAWFRDSEESSKRDEAITLLVVSVMIILVSSIEFCVEGKWLSFVRHVKSMAQTIAVTLIVFALYLYFQEDF